MLDLFCFRLVVLTPVLCLFAYMSIAGFIFLSYILFRFSGAFYSIMIFKSNISDL